MEYQFKVKVDTETKEEYWRQEIKSKQVKEKAPASIKVSLFILGIMIICLVLAAISARSDYCLIAAFISLPTAIILNIKYLMNNKKEGIMIAVLMSAALGFILYGIYPNLDQEKLYTFFKQEHIGDTLGVFALCLSLIFPLIDTIKSFYFFDKSKEDNLPKNK